MPHDHCETCTYNKTAPFDPTKCPAVHAEENAVIHSPRSGLFLDECILFVTKRPCEKCLNVARAAHIPFVLYFDNPGDQTIGGPWITIVRTRIPPKKRFQETANEVTLNLAKHMGKDPLQFDFNTIQFRSVRERYDKAKPS